jgi:hypothetical protein
MDLLRNIGVIDHTLQITSFGGVGTTMLYRFLEEHDANTPSGHDWLPWKHLPAPPVDSEVKEGFRAVYVFGNPMDAILSVFRRDFQHWHVQNMNTEQAYEEWNDQWTLRDFLNQERDYFRMREQFHNWIEADRSYPIMYVKFDTLWEHLPELFAFAGLPTRCIDEFPDQRERTSDWTEEEEFVWRGLREFYGDLWSEIQETPDFQIR